MPMRMTARTISSANLPLQVTDLQSLCPDLHLGVLLGVGHFPDWTCGQYHGLSVHRHQQLAGGLHLPHSLSAQPPGVYLLPSQPHSFPGSLPLPHTLLLYLRVCHLPMVCIHLQVREEYRRCMTRKTKPSSETQTSGILLSSVPSTSKTVRDCVLSACSGQTKCSVLSTSCKLNICCYSVTHLCQTLCDPADCSTTGFPVLHYLSGFAQTYVH